MPAVPSIALSACTIAFGEILLRFESDDAVWLGYLDRRFGAFATGARRGSEPAFSVRFDPTGGAPEDLASPLAAHLEEVRFERTESGLRIRTETTEGFVDLSGRRAVLRGPRAMYPIDNLLRHLLPILWREGLLIHAAAIERIGGRGVLAAGPSGAGKSTLARLAAGRALCDELTAFAIGDRPRVVSLPFWESRPGEAELEATLFLRHGEGNAIVPLRPGDALRLLSTQVLWPVWDEEAMAKAFTSLVELVDRVPAFELSFTPSAGVWDFIDQELS